VNARTDTQQTPLHLAAVAGHLNIVKILVMYKAKVNAKDSDHQCALHKFVFLYFSYILTFSRRAFNWLLSKHKITGIAFPLS
jgi:FOG: Ankyrin repeat